LMILLLLYKKGRKNLLKILINKGEIYGYFKNL
jgi:hypothetical protein